MGNFVTAYMELDKTVKRSPEKRYTPDLEEVIELGHSALKFTGLEVVPDPLESFFIKGRESLANGKSQAETAGVLSEYLLELKETLRQEHGVIIDLTDKNN